MHEHVYEQLDRNPDWRRLLTVYLARQSHEPSGWSDRLQELDDWTGQKLSKAHGCLIALGVLDFELGARTEGLKYQVNSLGKQVLSLELPSASDDESELDHEAQVTASPSELAEAA